MQARRRSPDAGWDERASTGAEMHETSINASTHTQHRHAASEHDTLLNLTTPRSFSAIKGEDRRSFETEYAKPVNGLRYRRRLFMLGKKAGRESAVAGKFTARASHRRIRRLEIGVASRLSFQSLTFFGAIAVLLGATFNIGLLAEFGLSFISLLAVDELVMTSFGLLVFLVPFYALALALLSQSYLVRNINRVLARRGANPRLRRVRNRALALAVLEIALIAGLIAIFAFYRGNSIGFAHVTTLIGILATSVVVLAYLGTGDDRSRIWLAGLQLATMCLASTYFGTIVASVRQMRSSEVVLEATTLKGGIVLMSKAGVFLRIQTDTGARRSVFIPASAVRRIID